MEETEAIQAASIAAVIEELLKQFLFDIVLKDLIADAIAAAPFLGFPIVNPVFVYLVTKVAKYYYQNTKDFLDAGLIDFKVATENKDYSRAKAALAKAIAGQKDVDEAVKEFQRTLGDLVHFTPDE